MLARVVKITCRHGQGQQTCKRIIDQVLPILKKQRGFLDEIVLVSTADPNHLLAQSFWRTPEDAELCNRTHFPKIREMMQDLLAGAPVIEEYNVDTSTAHAIIAGKAA